jgi:hypothetical protein
MLVFLSAITSIGLLRNSASNRKLKYIGFYTNLLRGVEIDQDKRRSKRSLKSFKAFISYSCYFEKAGFPALFYTL